MENRYYVLLRLHDNNETANIFAEKLEAFICDYQFHRLTQIIDPTMKHLPLVVVVSNDSSESSRFREVLHEIDQDITSQSHKGVITVVYFRTQPSKKFENIENNYKNIKCIVGMDFEKLTLDAYRGAKKEDNARARDKLRAAWSGTDIKPSQTSAEARKERAKIRKMDSQTTLLEQKGVVLLYDPEKRETSSLFTEELEKFIKVLEFRKFEDATEEDRQSLPIVVVVRSTSPRVEEDLNETARDLKGQLVDLGKVIVIYFQTNTDPKKTSKNSLIKVSSNSEGYKFCKIIKMDFSESSLYPYICSFKWRSPKPVNESAKQELVNAYRSLLNQRTSNYKAVVYCSDSTTIISDFLQYFEQKLSSVQLERINDLDSIEDEKTPLIAIRQIKKAGDCDLDPFKELTYKCGVIVLNIYETTSANMKNFALGIAPQRNLSTEQDLSAIFNSDTTQLYTTCTQTNISEQQYVGPPTQMIDNDISEDIAKVYQNKKGNKRLLNFDIYVIEGEKYIGTNMFSKIEDFLKDSQGV